MNSQSVCSGVVQGASKHVLGSTKGSKGKFKAIPMDKPPKSSLDVKDGFYLRPAKKSRTDTEQSGESDAPMTGD